MEKGAQIKLKSMTLNNFAEACFGVACVTDVDREHAATVRAYLTGKDLIIDKIVGPYIFLTCLASCLHISLFE